MGHENNISNQFHEAKYNDLPHRLFILNLTPDRLALLSSYQSAITESVDDIVQTFYDHQLTISEVANLIHDEETLSRLFAFQKQYVISLFCGQYDIEYVRNRLRIGAVHKELGVEPKLYLAAMSTLRTIIKQALLPYMPDQSTYIEVSAVINDLMQFDMTLVFETYIGSLIEELEEKKYQAEMNVKELTLKVKLDPLTQLYNQTAMLNALDREIALVKRQQSQLSFLYLDVDHFKRINDTQGHQHGDFVLKTVGDVILDSVRITDIPCRYGGDEFCIVLPQCELKDAKLIAEKIINDFNNIFADYSLSIGLSAIDPDSLCSTAELIEIADQHMYQAKQIPGSFIVA
jgi:diguanylate cyclase (GGDEF)-like protein